MDGWVKIHRKIKDHWIWDRPDYLKAWLDLIFRANYENSRILFDGEVNELNQGQFITSIRKLAEEWGWSKDKVLSFLRLLEKDQMINRVSDKRRTLITIENYCFYQVSRDTDSYTKQDTNSPQKRKKEEKNNNISNDEKKEKEERLEKDFQVLYDKYKKKRGRTEAFRRYKAWVTTGRKVNGKIVKLTNRKIWDAIKKYNEQQEGKDLEYYKNFDTFMGNSLLDFIDERE